MPHRFPFFVTSWRSPSSSPPSRTSATITFSRRAHVVVIGSGPAGSAVAHELARSGASVLVVEEGRWFEPHQYPLSAFASMSQSLRDTSASVVVGRALMPYVQRRMLGGSSPINGAICWRLPKDVCDEWIAADPALEDALPWETVEAVTDEIEGRLNVAPTEASIAGRKSEPMAIGAEALGLEHRPIRRNVTSCEGLGRCLQGGPKGRNRSVDATLLADAESHGAGVASSIEVTRIVVERGRAIGVEGRSAAGGRVRVFANRAVVLAASAVQSPVLLMRSGLDHGPVGRHFQCHPVVSMSGRFAEPVRMWEGATQGHEVTGLRHARLKFASLGFDLGGSRAASRASGASSPRTSATSLTTWIGAWRFVPRPRDVFGRSRGDHSSFSRRARGTSLDSGGACVCWAR